MKWVLTIPEIEIHPRESSSTIIAYVVRSSPMPPYSSGMVTPKSPSSFICSTTASGNLSSWSCSSAIGMTCSSTNCRTISVIARCSSVFSVYGVATAKSTSWSARFTRPSEDTQRRGALDHLRGALDRAWMPRDEAARRTRLAPARAAAGLGAALAAPVVAVARVEPQPGHDHERVAGVRVHGHPLAGPALAPMHEARGVHRAVEQAGAVQREGDRARAVVARVVPAAVAAAVLVRLLDDLVRGGDDLPHGLRGARGRDRLAVADGRLL